MAVGEVSTIDQITSVILLLDRIYALPLFIPSHLLSSSGGRVSIYVDDTTRFKGTYSARGGTGFQQGSAGTVFVEKRRGRMGGLLRISNQQSGDDDSHEQSPPAMHTIVSDISPYGPLDELHITGNARVVYKSAAQPLQVRRLIGDGSGTLVLSAGTALIPAGLGLGQLDAGGGGGGVLQLSNLTMVIVDGGVVQATDISIGDGGQLVLTSAGGTSLSKKAEYNFRNITVDGGGVIKIDYHMMNQGPSPLFETVSLSASDSFIVHTGGRVHSDSQGFFGSAGLPVASCRASINGRGCGRSGTAGGGGGAYGGFGGAGLSAEGGRHYGDAVLPSEPGSGGGGCFRHVVGGDGGGILLITASHMKIDGSVSANGGPGDGAGAGGGSGMLNAPLLSILCIDDVVALIRPHLSAMVPYRWVYSACR